MNTISTFFEAIKSGDQKAVERMLDQDLSLINARNENNVSAVLIAIYYNESAIANLLVTRGAELDIFESSAIGKKDRVQTLLDENPTLVNAYAPDGFQPLGLACFFGRTSVADLLLSRGAGVNSPSNNSSRVQPLHSAVAGRHYEIARSLLAHKADVNAVQEDGISPLHQAAQNKDLEMIKLLLVYNADLNIKKADGKTPLDIALENGYNKGAELLQQKK